MRSWTTLTRHVPVLVTALLLAAAPADAAARKCGNIAFTPQTEDGVFGIRATGTTCRTARRVARASRSIGIGESPYRYRARGFACRGRYEEQGLPQIRWRCTRDDGALVRFVRG